MKWNARTNLTAVRSAEEIVTRHFGESLFAARCIKAFAEAESMLDFGSGAGFPGIPVHLYLPELAVTLAESQGKKAAFLREAVRDLNLSAQVWSERVDAMPSAAKFDLVTTRAGELRASHEPNAVIPIRGTREGVVVLTKRVDA